MCTENTRKEEREMRRKKRIRAGDLQSLIKRNINPHIQNSVNFCSKKQSNSGKMQRYTPKPSIVNMLKDKEKEKILKREKVTYHIYIRGLSIIEQLIFFQEQWWPKAVVRHILDPEGGEYGTINYLSTVFQK